VKFRSFPAGAGHLLAEDPLATSFFEDLHLQV
jgi:hypothetical protein